MNPKINVVMKNNLSMFKPVIYIVTLFLLFGCATSPKKKLEYSFQVKTVGYKEIDLNKFKTYRNFSNLGSGYNHDSEFAFNYKQFYYIFIWNSHLHRGRSFLNNDIYFKWRNFFAIIDTIEKEVIVNDTIDLESKGHALFYTDSYMGIVADKRGAVEIHSDPVEDYIPCLILFNRNDPKHYKLHYFRNQGIVQISETNKQLRIVTAVLEPQVTDFLDFINSIGPKVPRGYFRRNGKYREYIYDSYLNNISAKDLNIENETVSK